MKNILSLCLLGLLLYGCGSSRSIDAFYDQHKEDDQVLAFRVPPVMFAMVKGLSPEMENLFGSTRDLRYIRLPADSGRGIQALNNQVSTLTAGSFIEIFRKNEGPKRNVVAIRERGNSVRDIMVFNNNELHGSLLYIKGNFDPEKVRSMARDEDFTDLQEKLVQGFGGPGINE